MGRGKVQGLDVSGHRERERNQVKEDPRLLTWVPRTPSPLQLQAPPAPISLLCPPQPRSSLFRWRPYAAVSSEVLILPRGLSLITSALSISRQEVRWRLQRDWGLGHPSPQHDREPAFSLSSEPSQISSQLAPCSAPLSLSGIFVLFSVTE